jgi:hypothetical protein
MTTPEEIAYNLLNRVGVPGWGDDITKAIADAIRDAEKRGWNAAKAACAKMISDCGCVAVSANETIKAIRALEKP